jgi:hypothetical protein
VDPSGSAGVVWCADGGSTIESARPSNKRFAVISIRFPLSRTGYERSGVHAARAGVAGAPKKPRPQPRESSVLDLRQSDARDSGRGRFEDEAAVSEQREHLDPRQASATARWDGPTGAAAQAEDRVWWRNGAHGPVFANRARCVAPLGARDHVAPAPHEDGVGKSSDAARVSSHPDARRHQTGCAERRRSEPDLRVRLPRLAAEQGGDLGADVGGQVARLRWLAAAAAAARSPRPRCRGDEPYRGAGRHPGSDRGASQQPTRNPPPRGPPAPPPVGTTGHWGHPFTDRRHQPHRPDAARVPLPSDPSVSDQQDLPNGGQRVPAGGHRWQRSISSATSDTDPGGTGRGRAALLTAMIGCPRQRAFCAALKLTPDD